MNSEILLWDRFSFIIDIILLYDLFLKSSVCVLILQESGV